MAIFQGVFFLVLGLGLVGVSWGSLTSGWLPYGPRRPGVDIRVRRAERPLFFWLLFIGYAGAGCWATVFALRVLVGTAQPLPLS